MKKQLLTDFIIILTILSYSLIYFSGGDLNGFLIYLLAGNAFMNEVFYGILPLTGILGMIVCLGIRRKFVLYLISFVLQFIPLWLDVIFHDRNVIKNVSFFVPALCYFIFTATGFSLISKCNK